VTRALLPDAVLARLVADDSALLASRLATRRAGQLVDARSSRVEVRANDDGTRTVVGYATTWDTWYDVAGGAPYGWAETIVRGAATKSLAERDDVRFLVEHDGLALARAGRTMTLTADEIGLMVEATLDPANPRAVELLSAIERGDVDQMSFAFQAVRQEWNSDYTERRITELRLFDVSAVTFPANPATIISARSTEPPASSGRPLGLAIAQAAAIR
jgi:uncharacterized protein